MVSDNIATRILSALKAPIRLVLFSASNGFIESKKMTKLILQSVRHLNRTQCLSIVKTSQRVLVYVKSTWAGAGRLKKLDRFDFNSH